MLGRRPASRCHDRAGGGDDVDVGFGHVEHRELTELAAELRGRLSRQACDREAGLGPGAVPGAALRWAGWDPALPEQELEREVRFAIAFLGLLDATGVVAGDHGDRPWKGWGGRRRG